MHLIDATDFDGDALSPLNEDILITDYLLTVAFDKFDSGVVDFIMEWRAQWQRFSIVLVYLVIFIDSLL